MLPCVYFILSLFVYTVIKEKSPIVPL